VLVSALRYSEALALTLLLEVPLYARALSSVIGARLGPAWIAGCVVNLISHPLGFLVIAPLTASMAGATGSLVVVELLAWMGEAVLLWAWLRRAPTAIALVSLLANSVSLLAGLALTA
jgi:hypothetical protein